MHVADQLHVHAIGRGGHQQLQVRRVRLQHVDVAFELVRQQRRFDFTVPTFDAAGHDGGPSVPTPSSAGWQACRPAAWPGLTTTPSGSVTVVFWMSALARPSVLSRPSWGTLTSAVRPVAVSASVVSGRNRQSRDQSRSLDLRSRSCRAFRAPAVDRAPRSVPATDGRRDAEPARGPRRRPSGNVRNASRQTPARYTPHRRDEL